MYTKTLIASVAGLIGLASAAPVEQSQAQTPYFEVRDFTWSKSDTSSRYSFSIDFPVDSVLSDSPEESTYTIPGSKDPVACTGTYFYSPSETSTVTPINACGFEDDKNAAITTNLDVANGDLVMNYIYNATINGEQRTYTWSAHQRGLTPVGPEAQEGFNTPATGPRIMSA